MFGNVTLKLNFKDLLQKNDKFSISSIQQFINGYNLYFDKIAKEDIRTIPSQFTQNIEFTYTDKKEKYNTSLVINQCV